jgi:hypothetical protein
MSRAPTTVTIVPTTFAWLRRLFMSTFSILSMQAVWKYYSLYSNAYINGNNIFYWYGT